jgi:hypothetical protein
MALVLGAGCSDDDGQPQVCGNGTIEGTELCDLDETGTADCANQGFAGGTLTCNNTCDGYDTSQCTTGDCGNGAIDAGEDCDATLLGGNDCTSVPGGYTGGTLACSTTCDFDTSSCTGGTTCGNGTIDTDEDCDDTLLGGNDCTTVGNYIGGTLACATDCTFDTSDCAPPLSCGNGAIDTGEDCDDTLLGGNDCTTVGGGFVAGSLACATDCTFDTDGCLTTSDQIAAARATADGTGLALPIAGAYVTYLKPQLGADAAGFYIQAQANGPALFVAVDPTTLAPVPVVGDEVSFSIIELDTADGMRQVLTIAGFSVASSGFNVASFIQDVSAATDLISALDDYESELISLDATIISDFANAGSPGRAAQIATAGYPTGAGDSLRLRIPSAVENALDLRAGCNVSVVGTPLWRFNADAQPSAWNASEITVNSCPAPELTGAAALSAVDVDLTFSTNIDAASLTNVPNQITFDQGVSAVSAVVNGSVVTVTTDGFGSGVTYTVTVAATVTDLLGAGVLATANSTTFIAPVTNEIDCADGLDEDADGYPDCLDTDCAADAACAFGAQLYIWELDSDQTGTDTQEFVEIWNNSGATVDLTNPGVFLLFINGSDALIDNVITLTGTVADGDVYVVGMAAVPNVDQTFTAFLQNDQEGVMLVSCAGCDTSDFPDDIDPTPSGGTFTTFNGRTATVLDAVAYCTGEADDAVLMAALGVSAQFDEGTNGLMSLVRTSLTGFVQATPDPGNAGFQP